MKKSKLITMVCLFLCATGLVTAAFTYDKKHSDYLEPAKITQQIEINGSSEEYYKVTTTSQNLHYAAVGACLISLTYNIWAGYSKKYE